MSNYCARGSLVKGKGHAIRLPAAGVSDMHAGGIDRGEDLPPFRRLQAIMRETALGTLTLE